MDSKLTQYLQEAKAHDKRRFDEHDDTMTKLIAICEKLLDASKDAIDTIHSEFCGGDKHHPLCKYPRDKIKECEEMLE